MARPLMAKTDFGAGENRSGWMPRVERSCIEANRTAGGMVIVIPQHVGLTDAQFGTGDTEAVATEIPISPAA